MILSIITPTILRPSLVQTCLSVDGQNYDNWQHIVMVDKAEDGLTEQENELLCKICETRREIHFTGKKDGINDFGFGAMNKGYDCVKGDFVMEIDDEDIYITEAQLFGALNKYIQDNPRANAILFPILRDGQIFYNKPPAKNMTCSNQYCYRPIINKKEMRYSESYKAYGSDGNFLEMILQETNFDYLDFVFPFARVDCISQGQKEITTFKEFFGRKQIGINLKK